MPTIPLSPRGETLVSDEDFELVSQYVWYWNEFGPKRNKRPRAYRRFKFGRTWKLVYLHRFLMKPEKGLSVDHINGDTLDNRRENLRICSHRDNMKNVKVRETPNKTSRYKGVYWDKARRAFLARIRVNKIEHRLGAFDNERDAALAYNKAAQRLHGEFCRLNAIVD